jgi:hypothetical protein
MRLNTSKSSVFNNATFWFQVAGFHREPSYHINLARSFFSLVKLQWEIQNACARHVAAGLSKLK